MQYADGVTDEIEEAGTRVSVLNKTICGGKPSNVGE